jgi:hypothetical protein
MSPVHSFTPCFFKVGFNKYPSTWSVLNESKIQHSFIINRQTSSVLLHVLHSFLADHCAINHYCSFKRISVQHASPPGHLLWNMFQTYLMSLVALWFIGRNSHSFKADLSSIKLALFKNLWKLVVTISVVLIAWYILTLKIAHEYFSRQNKFKHCYLIWRKCNPG